MVPVLKTLKVLTLYGHIVAQVNQRGLGVKVETNQMFFKLCPNEKCVKRYADP